MTTILAAALGAVILAELVLCLSLKRMTKRYRKFDPGQLVRGRLDEGGQLYFLEPGLGVIPRPNLVLSGKVFLDHQETRRFQIHTDKHGYRRTSNEEKANYPVIGCFGCSWTFGTALSDEHTYPWLIQERFPHRRVVNFGSGGFSLFQMLLRLEMALETEALDTVVIGYLPWHDERNVGRFHRIPWFSAPFVRAVKKSGGKSLELIRYPHRRSLQYKIAMYSSIVHCGQYFLNWLRGRKADDLKMQEIVTQLLFLAMRDLCRSRGVKLLVVSLQHGNLHTEFLTREGFSWIGISRNVMGSDESGRYPWLLLPYDFHPNEEANRLFASEISQALQLLENGVAVRPSQEFLVENRQYRPACPTETRNIYTLY